MKNLQFVRIKIEWHGFNYGRKENDPVFLKEDEVIEFARVTPKTFVVHYGQGRVKKVLKRFYRHDGGPRKSWREYYGSHERLSRTQIKFELLIP